jgi:undecaprenyl pyrophosphate phosphatase UppP
VAQQTDVAVEFRRRTRLVWRSIRLWVLLLIALALGFTFMDSNDAGFSQMLAMIGMVVVVGAIYAITRAVQRDYRCPACDQVPMGGSFGIGLGGGFSFDRDVLICPKACPSCGARLK